MDKWQFVYIEVYPTATNAGVDWGIIAFLMLTAVVVFACLILMWKDNKKIKKGAE